MIPSCDNRWLTRFAVFTAIATFSLLVVGGLVTSHGVGMAVPDWPNTYGYNMFLFPISKWVGGIFYEHTHRLVASLVGLLTAVLAVWLWAKETHGRSCWIGITTMVSVLVLMGIREMPIYLTLAGLAPIVIGVALRRFVLSPQSLRWLGVTAFAAVILQGVLGGLRVTLIEDQIGIIHGALAQVFLVLITLIALLTSGLWQRIRRESVAVSKELRRYLIAGIGLVFIQLVLGATMRHQHAGLAVPDFPLAYGKIWPPMDEASLIGINQRRMDGREFKPITAFQIGLHMAHRIGGLLTVAAVAAFAWKARRELGPKAGLSRGGVVWFLLILAQAALGAFTVWSNKAADIATAHVAVGALSLVCGTTLLAVLNRIQRVTGVQSADTEAAEKAASSQRATSPLLRFKDARRTA